LVIGAKTQNTLLTLETSTANYILKTEQLSIGYSTRTAPIVVQKNLNITLKKGTFVCLLGNNGVGKSTLLRTLSLMQPQLEGTILLNQKSIDTYNSQEIATEISLVLTEPIPTSNLSVLEVVALGRQPYTNWIGNLSFDDHTIIAQAMEQTQVAKFATKKLHELSDGQKQRVMIARALAQNTPLIFLDEPTAHLDIHYKISILSLLKTICKTLDKSIVIATHEISFATQLADQLWLMFPDKFVSGAPDELIKNKSLQKLFNTNLVSFDANSKHFSIKNR